MYKHNNLNDVSFFENDQINVRSNQIIDGVKYYGQDVIVNDARVGTFSNMYKINRTDQILRNVNDEIVKSNIDYKDVSIIDRHWSNGGKNSRTITFNNESIAPAKKIGDVSSMQITILNSYDGSMKASVAFGLLRLVCLNGMMALSTLSSFAKKHSNADVLNNEYGKIESFKSLLDAHRNSIDVMSNKTITLAQAKQLFNSTIAKNEVKEKTLIEYVQKNNRDAHDSINVYDLYNGVTEWATHHETRKTADNNNVYLSRQMDVTKLLQSENFLQLVA